MKSRLAWSILSLLMAGVLLLISCGPQAAPAPAPTPTPTPGAPTPVPTPGAPTPAPTPAPGAPAVEEKPKYGGTVVALRPSISEGFDTAASTTGHTDVSLLVYEQFLYPDWSKGLAGDGTVDWGSGVSRFEGWGGQLAESWQIPEVGTWILNIRKGVHYALNPASEASRLMNGREFTADDAVYNVRRNTIDPCCPNAGIRRSLPTMSKTTTVEKTGPWQITIKTPADPWNGFFWVIWGGTSTAMWAPEVIQKYGNVLDWRNAVGTGSFMITDHVSGSATTFSRNPNYWGKNPTGPGKGDQLPYTDTHKLLIVPDLSTRLASMRTGRADWITDVETEDAKSLIRTNTSLQSKRYIPYGRSVSMRIDKQDLPFKDKRVRHALMMATDFESIKNELYGGDAEILVYPLPPTYGWLHTPMDKLSPEVQALYKYNPDGAKKLLAEAGYPNGFKTAMIVQNVSTDMDPAAALKAMWIKAGIDVELQPREQAVYASISTARSWEEMFMGGAGVSTLLTSILSLSGYRGESVTAVIKDDKVIQVFEEMKKHVFINQPKADELYRNLVPYMLEQAYVIPRPVPYSYTVWQPWIKNYRGEKASGALTQDFWPYHIWVDRDLKEKLTGRR